MSIRNLTRFVFLLLVLFVVTSCADTPLTFRFDPDTTPEEIAAATPAFPKWAKVASSDSVPVLEPNGYWRITFTDDIGPHDGFPGSRFDGRTCADHAKHCPSDYQILIRRQRDGVHLTPHRIEEIMRHELGHALGLEHVTDDETATMWGVKGRARTKTITSTFTESDLLECRRAGACASVSVSLAELWRGRRRPTECDD